ALSDEEFREQLRQGIDQFSRNKPVKPSVWKSFSRGIEFHAGEFHEPATYADLAKRLGAAGLAETGEARRDGKRGWVRVIVEKPFGSDIGSARKLNREIGE